MLVRCPAAVGILDQFPGVTELADHRDHAEVLSHVVAVLDAVQVVVRRLDAPSAGALFSSVPTIFRSPPIGFSASLRRLRSGAGPLLTPACRARSCAAGTARRSKAS